MGAHGQHVKGDCEHHVKGGHLCDRWAMYKMVREDGSEQLLCTRHLNLIKEYRAANAELFSPVKFVTVK